MAASIYQDSRDPSSEINHYLVTNKIVPPNIRSDSRQSDVWRDYQQVLSELGLITSTRGRNRIGFTPIGLAFLDGAIGFTDLITRQALRAQYPNGHHTNLTAGAGRSSVDGSFAEQQARTGIIIKPGILVWQVLDGLIEAGAESSLSATEIERFLIPCRTNQEAALAIAAILAFRAGSRPVQASLQSKRRNASDWTKLLGRTHVFALRRDSRLVLSVFSRANRGEIRRELIDLLRPEKFWLPTADSSSNSWYSWFGELDTDVYPISEEERPGTAEYAGGKEPEEDNSTEDAIILRPFGLIDEEHIEESYPRGEDISSVYSADLSNSAHRLHDSMVRLIAKRCITKQASVFEDPRTVDLLVLHRGIELLIEVKSANALNLVKKVRTAVGQVLHYDYLRSLQSSSRRRRVVALTIDVPREHWAKRFMCDYLAMDLLSLRQGELNVYTDDAIAASFFGTES
ncbi:MAG TPA: hypothetical protein VFW25_10400 [Silvibacterium sp.]|nr:hypothetical protein [Silvibacterium sp.]